MRLRIVCSYAVAALLVAWLWRGADAGDVLRHLKGARLELFLPVALGAFSCWFLGETWLYSRAFGFFHREIAWRDMLPLSAAMYGGQLINGAVAGAMFAALVHKRRGVPWLEVGFTLLFLSLLDIQLLALMVLLMAPFGSGLALPWAGVALVACWIMCAFWLRGRPSGPWAQRLYDWAPMGTFRKARARHYLRLGGIRATIFLAQGLALYAEMRAFGVAAPPGYVLALTPALLLLTALPLTPVGLGTEQAVLVLGFQAFAPKPTLLAMSMATGGIGMVLRALVAPLALTRRAPNAC